MHIKVLNNYTGLHNHYLKQGIKHFYGPESSHMPISNQFLTPS